jgi:hypothetical protein
MGVQARWAMGVQAGRGDRKRRELTFAAACVGSPLWAPEAETRSAMTVWIYVAALEAAGITFLPETPNGVGLRGRIES